MNKPTKICIAVGLALLGGCGRHKSDKAKDALVDQLGVYGGPEAAKLRVRKGGKLSDVKPPELPGKVQGLGLHIPWYAPDPKNPDSGKPQRVLIADAKRGAFVNKKSGGSVILREVHATLYHEDKPSATLDAPTVTTNERDRILIATGGVTIHALIDPQNAKTGKVTPAKTTVTADKVVWNSHTTQVVCTGNAHLVRKQPGQPEFESLSERMVYNTDTGEFEFSSDLH